MLLFLLLLSRFSFCSMSQDGEYKGSWIPSSIHPLTLCPLTAASPVWDAPPPSPTLAAVQPPTPAPASPSAPEQYTVITRGVTFHLFRSQIEFDSPNYFTSAFLEGFAEAQSQVVHLDRNPQLFALVVEHVSG